MRYLIAVLFIILCYRIWVDMTTYHSLEEDKSWVGK